VLPLPVPVDRRRRRAGGPDAADGPVAAPRYPLSNAGARCEFDAVRGCRDEPIQRQVAGQIAFRLGVAFQEGMTTGTMRG